MPNLSSSVRPFLAFAIGVASLGIASYAEAQSMNGPTAGYNAGYGRVAGQENQPVDPVIRDGNGNWVTVDGIVEAGQDQSGLSNAGVGGAFDTVSGVGVQGTSSVFGSAIAVANATAGASANAEASTSVTVTVTKPNSGHSYDNSSLNGGVSYDH